MGVSDTLQAREEARTGVCAETGGGLNPPSSLTNPNQRLQHPLQGGEQGGGRAAK